MTEQELLRILNRYGYLKERLKQAEERLNSMGYKITPAYSNSGGGRVSGVSSKVEDFAIKREKLISQADGYRRKLRIADAALNCKELSPLEGDVLHWITTGARLATFANLRGIYISRVYKIRDKALQKAIKHITRQNAG